MRGPLARPGTGPGARARTRNRVGALNAPLRFACRPDETFEAARIAETLADIEKAFDAVKYGAFPDAPYLDVRVPTVSDPSLAPDGHHVVSILAYGVPYTLEGGWDDGKREELGDRVVRRLAEYAPELETSIVATAAIRIVGSCGYRGARLCGSPLPPTRAVSATD